MEQDLSQPTLEGIERELQLISLRLAEANDIATIRAFTPIPADLDNESRKALRQLRDQVMERARMRAAESRRPLRAIATAAKSSAA